MEPLALKIDDKTVHAGILPRLYARVIDSMAIGFFSFVCYYSGKLNLALFILSMVCYAFIIFIYLVYANYKYGATPGKFVASIRVTRLDGSKISLKQSFIRSSVDLALVAVAWGVFIYALSIIGLEKYHSAEVWERASLQTSVSPWWQKSIVRYFSYAWFFAGVIVFLLNKKRRAIHDYMGKTIVVFEEYSEIGGNSEKVKRIGNTEFFVNVKLVILQFVFGGTILSMIFWMFF